MNTINDNDDASGIYLVSPLGRLPHDDLSTASADDDSSWGDDAEAPPTSSYNGSGANYFLPSDEPLLPSTAELFDE